jgi:hypothetical protein
MLQVRVPKEETSMVSDLRYGWKKLRKLSMEISDNLASLQVRTEALHTALHTLCAITRPGACYVL